MRIRWRGLELPNKVECTKLASAREGGLPTFGRFSVESFERGFGTTIGVSLRRVLLSSLEGSAVTKMKLRGAGHECASLEGMVEDVTEVVLNVKSLIVRSLDDKPRVIRIEKNGPGLVTAADIIPDSQIEIINKDLVIATLTTDRPFDLEMVVENGRGYVPASEQAANQQGNSDVEYIPLDASFSPVVKVKYEVEETRVGQKTNYERLILEITTDGTITPEMALTEASKILRKFLNPFVQYDRLDGAVFSRSKSTGGDGVDPALEAKLSMTLSDLKLSVRAMNCLANGKISTVRELVACTEDDLLELKNLGKTTSDEVKEKLAEIGLHLGMRLPTPPAQGPKFN